MSNETSIMKRRGFLIKAGYGLAGILAAGKCPAIVVKKLIGNAGSMINSSDSPGDVFDNPYIMDGLVAMYDGEWNTAIGVHKSSTSTWKNLMKNSQLDFNISGMIIGDNYVDTNRKTSETLPVIHLSDFTIEVVGYSRGNISSWAQVTPFLAYGSNGNIPFGFGPTRSWANILFYCYGTDDGLNDAYSYEKAYADESFSICRSWSGQSIMSGQRLLFKNGTQLTNNTWRPRQGTFYPTNFNKLMIGFYCQADGSVSSNYIPMIVLNTIRFYDRALSYDEVMHNYAIDQERFGVGVI